MKDRGKRAFYILLYFKNTYFSDSCEDLILSDMFNSDVVQICFFTKNQIAVREELVKASNLTI